jgi:hypothetical protein
LCIIAIVAGVAIAVVISVMDAVTITVMIALTIAEMSSASFPAPIVPLRGLPTEQSPRIVLNGN